MSKELSTGAAPAPRPGRALPMPFIVSASRRWPASTVSTFTRTLAPTLTRSATFLT
jgi:hypothetical protein